jgi:hypothetical protein
VNSFVVFSSRAYILEKIQRKKQLPQNDNRPSYDIEAKISRHAAVIRENVDIPAIYRLLKL